jgi:hypothetical protein
MNRSATLLVIAVALAKPSQPSFHAPSAFRSFVFEADPARRK